MHMTNNTALRPLLVSAALVILVSGCFLAPKTHPPKSAARQHVDAKAQQQYYDLGLQQYSNENYGEAREAFKQVIDLGPNTSLGIKAQENLGKIQRILKTVEELEAK